MFRELLILRYELLRWWAKDVMDLLHLVDFALTGKQCEFTEKLEDNAAYAPYIHLQVVVAVGKYAFGCSVPPRADVFSVRELRQLT